VSVAKRHGSVWIEYFGENCSHLALYERSSQCFLLFVIIKLADIGRLQ